MKIGYLGAFLLLPNFQPGLFALWRPAQRELPGEAPLNNAERGRRQFVKGAAKSSPRPAIASTNQESFDHAQPFWQEPAIVASFRSES
jgi:hypothetical protein